MFLTVRKDDCSNVSQKCLVIVCHRAEQTTDCSIQWVHRSKVYLHSLADWRLYSWQLDTSSRRSPWRNYGHGERNTAD